MHLCTCPLNYSIVSSLGVMQEIQVASFSVSDWYYLAIVVYGPIKKIAKCPLDYTDMNFSFWNSLKKV